MYLEMIESEKREGGIEQVMLTKIFHLLVLASRAYIFCPKLPEVGFLSREPKAQPAGPPTPDMSTSVFEIILTSLDCPIRKVSRTT